MTVVIVIVNRIFTELLRVLLRPFQGFDPIWALSFISLLTGILMLWLFGKVSNQEAIQRVKGRIRGNLLAVLLYQHDVRVVLRLQGRILRDTLLYLRYAMAPMLVLLVPAVLIIAQLNLFFSMRPLQPGEAAVVKIKFDDPALLGAGVTLEGNSALIVETPAVRIPSEREIAWRVRAEQTGRQPLIFRIGQHTLAKEIRVGGSWGAVPILRTGGWLDLLLYPGEEPLLPSDKLRSIEVKHQPLPLSIAGWGVHWLVFFLVLSILFSFAFQRALGVEL